MSTIYNGLMVKQYANGYEIYVPLGFMTCAICMPNDGQFIQDSWCIDKFTKALVLRWRLNKQKKKDDKKGGENSRAENNHVGMAVYFGLNVKQIETNQYNIYLPNGRQVAFLFMPPDANYQDDRALIKGMCKCLAKRYGII